MISGTCNVHNLPKFTREFSIAHTVNRFRNCSEDSVQVTPDLGVSLGLLHPLEQGAGVLVDEVARRRRVEVEPALVQRVRDDPAAVVVLAELLLIRPTLRQ